MYATTPPDTFQAPNFIDVNNKLPDIIDNSIRSPSWPTGTAIRKSPPSLAARQRKTWPSLPHCAACGDTPASAIRARSTRRAIICLRDYANRPSGRSRRIDTLGGAFKAVCPRRCWQQPGPPIRAPSLAPDGHSEPSSGSCCAPAACRSSAGSRRAQGPGWRRNGEDRGYEHRRAWPALGPDTSSRQCG